MKFIIAIIDEAYELMPQYFLELPNSKVIVKPVPPYSEKSAAGGHYRGPISSRAVKTNDAFFYKLYKSIKATPKSE